MIIQTAPAGEPRLAVMMHEHTALSGQFARARQKSGRVAIANSDSGGDAYAHLAIEQAARAVRELLG